MIDFYNFFAYCLFLICGILLGQTWFWLRKIYKSNAELSDKLFQYHSETQKNIYELHTKVVIIETQMSERRKHTPVLDMKIEDAKQAKRKPGRPPKNSAEKSP